MKLIKKTFQKNWQEYWLILRYYQLYALGSFLVIVIFATITAIKVERSYKAHGEIRLESNNQNSSLKLLDIPIQDKQEQASLAEGVSFLSSSSLVEKVIEELKLTDHQGNLLEYDKFIHKLNITQNEKTEALTVTYTCNNIDQSKLVVNSLISSYINNQLEIHRHKILEIKNILDEQLASALTRLQHNRTELYQFLEKYEQDILETSDEDNIKKLREIDQKIESAKSEIQKIDQEIIEIRLKLGTTASPIPKFNQNSSSTKNQALDSKFNVNSSVTTNLKLDKSELETNFYKTSNSKVFIVTKEPENIAKLTEKLTIYEAEKKIRLAQIETWEKSKINHKKKSEINASEIQQQYQDLLERTQAAETEYNSLFRKSQQLVIASNQVINPPVEILSPVTIENNLSSRNKEIIIITGMGLGLILALATVIILEKRNPSLKTTEKICELLNAELLGRIPNLKHFYFCDLGSSKPILPARSVLEAPYSVASQAHKIVYNHLESDTVEQSIQLVTISSSASQEGKSTFSANLAALTAQLGKKVLLIDANFHQPKQHEIWQLSNSLGLAYLLKNMAKFEDIVQSPCLNLDIITTGFFIGCSLSLFQLETMQQLIEQVKKQYDLIIFDTPPINLYPDALIINKFTDGMVLVGRTGITNSDNLIRAKELIDKLQPIILGVVVNDKMLSLTRF